jgi:hypothetical protein
MLNISSMYLMMANKLQTWKFGFRVCLYESLASMKFVEKILSCKIGTLQEFYQIRFSKSN